MLNLAYWKLGLFDRYGLYSNEEVVNVLNDVTAYKKVFGFFHDLSIATKTYSLSDYAEDTIREYFEGDVLLKRNWILKLEDIQKLAKEHTLDIHAISCIYGNMYCQLDNEWNVAPSVGEESAPKKVLSRDDKNQLIAEFMGYDKDLHGGDRVFYYTQIDHSDQECSADELRFHESWDWLHLPLNRLKEFLLSRVETEEEIVHSIEDAFWCNNLEGAFELVVEGIIQYNEQ